MTRSLLALVLAAPMALAPPAHAAPDADALISQGLALRKQGKDQEALERFRQAEALQATPRALAQIALAEQALGRWVEAERDLTQAVANDDDAWIRRRQSDLAESLAEIRKHLGDLEVLGAPAGATITINGQPSGTAPLPGPLRVPAGTVALGVGAPGYIYVARSVFVAAGSLARETVTLVPAPAAGGPQVTDVFAGRIEADQRAAEAARPARRRGLGLLALGGAVAGLGVGTVFTVIRYGKVSDYNDRAGCGTDFMNHGAAGCADLADQASHAQIGAMAGFAGAALLGGLGAYLLLSQPASGEHVALCAPTPGRLGVGCAVRF